MNIDSTDSAGAARADGDLENRDFVDADAVVPDDQFDEDDAAGDAISGVTPDDDGVPTATGSIPPGPGTPDDDDVTDATHLPPLQDRMY